MRISISYVSIYSQHPLIRTLNGPRNIFELLIKVVKGHQNAIKNTRKYLFAFFQAKGGSCLINLMVIDLSDFHTLFHLQRLSKAIKGLTEKGQFS